MIVLGSNVLRRLDNLQFSSKAALIFWSSYESCLRFLGGDSMSDVSYLLTVILHGLTMGPKVLRTSDL